MDCKNIYTPPEVIKLIDKGNHINYLKEELKMKADVWSFGLILL